MYLTARSSVLPSPILPGIFELTYVGQADSHFGKAMKSLKFSIMKTGDQEREKIPSAARQSQYIENHIIFENYYLSLSFQIIKSFTAKAT